MRWLTIIILVLVVLFFWRFCSQDINDTAKLTKDSVSSVTDKAGDMADGLSDTVNDMAEGLSDTVDDLASDSSNTGDDTTASENFDSDNVDTFTKELRSRFSLKGNQHGMESKLLDFIESGAAVDNSKWFNFDRLTFKTGSANIDMSHSNDQLTNIADILKAHPDVLLKIGGYTDNTGSDEVNLRISQQRAEAVVTALAGMGIDSSRLDPEGYGSQHPVASNDTSEGRAMNRRIAVRVTSK